MSSSPCRLLSPLLDHKDSFPLHFNFRFNPDNCSCLTHHWQLAALSSFKNTNSRKTECAVAVGMRPRWHTHSRGYVFECLSVCCPLSALTASSLARFVQRWALVIVLLICPLVSSSIVCFPVIRVNIPKSEGIKLFHRDRPDLHNLQKDPQTTWQHKDYVYNLNSFPQKQETHCHNYHQPQ